MSSVHNPLDNTSDRRRYVESHAGRDLVLSIVRLPELEEDSDSLNPAEAEIRTAEISAGIARSLAHTYPSVRSALSLSAPPRPMSAKEAATALGALDRDGNPSDRFYNRIAPKIGIRGGSRWTFDSDKVQAYRRGEIT
jgi:hypothetical protein